MFQAMTRPRSFLWCVHINHLS